MNEPEILVVVTYYEDLPSLRRCITGFNDQTAHFRGVLIDDGSSPLTSERVASLVEGDKRWEIRRFGTNRGPAAARREGIRWATETGRESDVVVFWDGDDWPARNDALAIIRQRYVCNPACQMTLGSWRPEPADARPQPAPYAKWHLALGVIRHISWRGNHPRSVRLGVLQEVLPNVRDRWPWGAYLRGATDMAIFMPVLERLEPHQLEQIEEVLYVYNLARPDGRNIHRSRRGWWRQLSGAIWVRRSILHLLSKRLARVPLDVSRLDAWLDRIVGPGT